MATKLARVLPISGFEKLLDYRVPPTIESTLKLGCLVRIPIRNRQELGIVMEFPKKGQLPLDKLKLITQQVMEHPALTRDSTRTPLRKGIFSPVSLSMMNNLATNSSP